MNLNKQEKNDQENKNEHWEIFLREVHEAMSSALDRIKTLFKGKGNTLIRNKNATCDNGTEKDLSTYSNIN